MVLRKRELFISGIVILIFVIIMLVIYLFPFKEGFSVRPNNLKINLVSGEEVTKDIKIINKELSSQNFKVYFNENLEVMASLSESSFTLGAKNKRTIVLSFKDVNNRSEIYLGKLIIEGYTLSEEIPIIFNVELVQPEDSTLEEDSSKYDSILLKNMWILLIIIFAFIGMVLFLYFYFSKTKDKLLSQLKEQHESELKGQKNRFDFSKRSLKGLKSGILNIKKIQELDNKRKNTFKKIRNRQVREMSQFNKLKKQGKGKKELRDKIESWGRKRALNNSIKQYEKKSKKN